MSLTIKNREVEALAAELASWTGETKTEAVKQALLERRTRVKIGRGGPHKSRLEQFLQTHIWPAIPSKALGKPVSKAQREAILGYGPKGI